MILRDPYKWSKKVSSHLIDADLAFLWTSHEEGTLHGVSWTIEYDDGTYQRIWFTNSGDAVLLGTYAEQEVPEGFPESLTISEQFEVLVLDQRTYVVACVVGLRELDRLAHRLLHSRVIAERGLRHYHELSEMVENEATGTSSGKKKSSKKKKAKKSVKKSSKKKSKKKSKNRKRE